MERIREADKIGGRLLFNFLASDRENAEEVVEAARGYVIPGIAAADMADVSEAVRKVQALQQVAPVVSIGLGGNGDASQWRRVLDIAIAAKPGHINQPFETSAYARGVLEGLEMPHLVNALVVPTGTVGVVRLSDGTEMDVQTFVAIARAQGIQSIKVMPVKGLQHLEELVEIARVAADAGIYGMEPAGGIDASNVERLVEAVLGTGISFLMPHVFGTTIDPVTKRTRPERVKEIVERFL